MNTEDIFKCGTKLYPSLTKAELVAIFTVLLTIPEYCEVKIFTDSQAAIDGIKKSMDNINYSRKILTLHNHSTLFKILELVQGKSLNLELVKVKGHSEDIFNNQADQLAKEGQKKL